MPSRTAAGIVFYMDTTATCECTLTLHFVSTLSADVHRAVHAGDIRLSAGGDAFLCDGCDEATTSKPGANEDGEVSVFCPDCVDSWWERLAEDLRAEGLI